MGKWRPTTAICDKLLNLILDGFVCNAKIDYTAGFETYEGDLDTWFLLDSRFVESLGGSRGRKILLAKKNRMHNRLISNAMPVYESNHG